MKNLMQAAKKMMERKTRVETVWQHKDEPEAQCCPKCYHELPKLEMKNGTPHPQNQNIYVTQTKCPSCGVDIRVFWA